MATISLPPVRPMTFPSAIEFSFNPGPWNIKEHLLVYIVANVTVGSPYAINVIVRRRLFNTNGKLVFRARAVPASVLNFDIRITRTTRTVALRAGKAIEKEIGPRKTLTKAELTQTFLNVPGHKRASAIAIASAAAVTIAPRMTKVASLRIGPTQTPAPKPVSRAVTDEEKEEETDIQGVPGHKRREPISVMSTAAPTGIRVLH
ncbi:hypothetical protein M378DRAFT_15374 [Amanita muscaria Koide BX008]|uniref:Uncharacterized protein n=1 Tax=Amanita muscaria (strain Koide BX008) TaxID=946122 RepID=A0A0C2SX20_AMAMK|nr:hypothetical protein M378DRAFT_15374 [Amanita muscaria Koide BX008]